MDSVYWIWMQFLFGIGTRRAELFMDYFANPREIYQSIRENGRAVGMLEETERTAWDSAMEQAANVRQRSLRKGVEIITPDHPKYPKPLQNIYSKPAVLYARGDLACLSHRLAIAMVGTRAHTDYGKIAAQEISGDLAKAGVVIVSGLAKGIDTFCHQAALDAGGVTVGILGCGLDADYPKGSVRLKQDICKNGAVVTEYPLGTAPRPQNFPLRNRILSGISSGVVVVEADLRSGSLITAGHALEQGKDVFAVPGSIFSIRQQGTHALLRDGAILAEDAADILTEYGIAAKKKTSRPMYNDSPTRTTTIEKRAAVDTGQIAMKPVKKPIPADLSQEGAAILSLLGAVPTGVEMLAEKGQMPIPSLQTALTELEIYGLIKIYPGRAFALNE